MLSQIISAFGIFIIGIGTFVRVVPDLDRPVRRRFYQNAPVTRDLFEIRKDIKQSDKGNRFTIENRRVSREFIDYVDAHGTEEPPNCLPKRIKNVAAQIQVEYENGDDGIYLRGTRAQRTLVELLTLSIERSCRNFGLSIALIGTLIAISGTLL
jgi:hypothetical protein